MLIPNFLKSGDTIAIVSTARKIAKNDVLRAIELFKGWELQVRTGKHLFCEHNQFAGNDRERAEDFQNMLDDSDVKAIICARGGYGTIKIMDFLNFEKFKKSPKWIIGYSDVTVLHSSLHQLFKIKSLHATMPLDFPKNDTSSHPSIETLKKALFGEKLLYRFSNHPLNKNGKVEGILTGGNLSILYSLRGTPFDINTDGKILFLEDIDEYLYHIDRMMMNLKLGGKLSRLKGLLIGGMTDMRDNQIPFGKTAEEIIYEAVKDYDYPVCFGVPAGHLQTNNQALILGGKIEITVADKYSQLEF